MAEPPKPPERKPQLPGEIRGLKPAEIIVNPGMGSKSKGTRFSGAPLVGGKHEKPVKQIALLGSVGKHQLIKRWGITKHPERVTDQVKQMIEILKQNPQSHAVELANGFRLERHPTAGFFVLVDKHGPFGPRQAIFGLNGAVIARHGQKLTH